MNLQDGESSLRASDITVSPEDFMVRSRTFKATGYLAVGNLQSETYYETRLGKGDEIADRSFNYAADGITIKSKSVFEYGVMNLQDGESGLAASNTTVSPEDFMVRSVSYKATGYLSVGAKTSETYYETRLGKGDEIADRSFNYAADG